MNQTQPARILLSRLELAQALGCSERQTHILQSKGLIPAPIALGPRCQRWSASEVTEFLQRAPRAMSRGEPQELLRARIERQKETGVPA
jgi:predicted DNA-binding transcriptional regulator AlpA